MQIEINLKNTLSLQKIRVNVPSVFTVAIGTSPELMENAAQRMLELSIDEIKYQAEEIIYGQLRDVIASMTIEQINNERDLFAKKVEEIVELELHKLGLVLINVNFTDVTDQSGAIEALGKKAAAEALQNARIDVSEKEKLGAIGETNAIRERDIEVAKQHAEREKGVNLAKVNKDVTIKEQERDMWIRLEKANSEKEIGINLAKTEKEKQILTQKRDLQIVTATTKSQQEIATSQANLEQEKLIAIQEKETRIAVSLANAEAIKGENDAKIQIEKANTQLNLIKAESFEESEKRKKLAEGNVLETEFIVKEKVAKAKEQQIKAENLAVTVGPAEALKFKEIIEAETNAQKKIIEAESIAQSILKEAEAKAKGEYLFLEARALGLGKLIEQCGSSKDAVQLLMLDHIEELAKISATAISNIKFDKITVWESGNQKDGNLTSNFIKNIATSLPPLHSVMNNVAGVDMEKFLGGVINVPEKKNDSKEESKIDEETKSRKKH